MTVAAAPRRDAGVAGTEAETIAGDTLDRQAGLNCG
jgi:hypothetical protein